MLTIVDVTEQSAHTSFIGGASASASASASTSSSISNNLIGVGRSTTVFEFFMTTLKNIVTGRILKDLFIGFSTEVLPPNTPPQMPRSVANQPSSGVETANSMSPAVDMIDPARPVAESPSWIERLRKLFSTTPTPPVAEAKPSFFTRMLISMLKLFSSESDSFVDFMRKFDAVKNVGFALVGIGAASLALLFPPAAPFAVSTLLLLGVAYFLLDWFEPQISNMVAKLITKVIENQSPEVKALGTGLAGAFITNNHGGNEMDDLAVSVAGAVISYAADRLDQPAATATAATAGIGMTVAGANRTSFLYNDLPCVKAASALGVLSCMGVLGFKIDNSEEAAKIALTSAQFVDQHRSLIIALFSRDVTTAGGIILGNRMVAYVSENILPEWAQKTAVASAFRTVCNNAVNYYVMGFTGGVVAPTFLTLLAGPAISALVAYDRKTGGRLEKQTQYFLEEGRKNVKNAVESMELVATHAPENALKVMKLARENTWNAVTTLLNGSETPVEEADPSTLAKFFGALAHGVSVIRYNIYERNDDQVMIEEIIDGEFD